MANTYLTRSISSTSTPNKMTVSFWLKGGQVSSTQQTIFSIYNTANANLFWTIYFSSNGSMYLYWKDTSEVCTLGTTQKFTDTQGWYHFVWEMDTTLATAADRIKMYINGERVTDFEDSLGTITQSKSMDMMENTNGRITIGRGAIGGSDYYWDGLLSHFHYCDGYAYSASSFGSTDSTTGEWKINTSPSVSYGTNGFFMLKDDASLNDDSGQTNNFTLGGGTITPTQDCPSNSFCTISPLDNMSANNTTVPGKLRYGNTSFNTSDSNQIYTRGTIGVKSGKYYWEAKQGDGSQWVIGIIVEAMLTQTNNQFWDTTTVCGVAVNGSSGNLYINGGSGDSLNTGISVNANTIYGFALDVDNRAFYVHVNGTYITANSAVGDPTSGSSRTGSVLGELTTRGGTGGLNYIPVDEYIYPLMADVATSGNSQLKMNFGNGYFDTTAISSEGTNAAGHGKFEYNVPTGYTALCTKGLNE